MIYIEYMYIYIYIYIYIYWIVYIYYSTRNKLCIRESFWPCLLHYILHKF